MADAANKVSTPNGIQPFQMMKAAVQGMCTIGSKIAHVSAKLFKDVDATRGVTLFTLGVLDAQEQLGYPVKKYAAIRSTLKSFNDVICARSIIPRFDTFLTGDALWKNVNPNLGIPNMALICSRVAYLVYDFLGLVNVLEKLAVVSQGVGDAISGKMFGVGLDEARPVFGYLASAFNLVDVVKTAYTAYKKGITFDTFLEVGIDIGRMASFAYGRTLTGSLFKVGSCVCSTTRFVKKNW